MYVIKMYDMALLSPHSAGRNMSSQIPRDKPKLDWDKLSRLVHYVCDEAPNPKLLGATKLNKILYYSDFEAYLQLGAPITGEVYVKQKHGPVPKHVMTVLDRLKESEAIAIAQASGYFAYTGEPSYAPRLFHSLRRPDIHDFLPDEIRIVDEVIRVICLEHTATSISNLSHDLIWNAAEIGEEIPYFTAFAQLLGDIDAKDIAWAKGTIAKRNA